MPAQKGDRRESNVPRGVLCALGDGGALGANAGSFCVSIRRLHLCVLEICGQPSALHAHTEPRARHIGCNLHTYLGSQSLLSPDAVVYICSLQKRTNNSRACCRATLCSRVAGTHTFTEGSADSSRSRSRRQRTERETGGTNRRVSKVLLFAVRVASCKVASGRRRTLFILWLPVRRGRANRAARYCTNLYLFLVPLSDNPSSALSLSFISFSYLLSSASSSLRTRAL